MVLFQYTCCPLETCRCTCMLPCTLSLLSSYLYVNFASDLFHSDDYVLPPNGDVLTSDGLPPNLCCTKWSVLYHLIMVVVVTMWTWVDDLFLHSLNSIDVWLLVRGIPNISTLAWSVGTLIPVLLCVQVGRSELDDKSFLKSVFIDVNFSWSLHA